MEQLDTTREILGDLIAFPTISHDSNLEMISYLAARLEAVGARVDVLPDPSGTKANLFATIGPDAPGGIVLSGHSDVVPVEDQPWTVDPFSMTARDGLLYGRGSCDMKGFIAATVAMAGQFAGRDLRRPVHFAFTYDEEIGCFGAQALAETLDRTGISPAMAIIGEPTEMRIIEGHKGCYEYSTHFKGTEGHGSQPELGVNAVEYAVRYVARLLELKDDLRARATPQSRFSPPWTTVNVGALTGGMAHNVIASKARVDWEMRPVSAEDADYVKRHLRAYCEDHLLPAMQAVAPEASILTDVIGEVDGLQVVDDNAARDLVAALTGSNSTDVVSFGTEAGIFQERGMNVVVCGPGSIAQAHQADEFLSEAQLAECLTMLGKLAKTLETPRAGA
ncbi:acetylornithine deacetylase [Marinibacterium profundimaris]|uniref:Acetylornithine deacetylase n=1 Tax=Marinibacterium profundimaris TaxID=1679460 RepID=A0A225NLT8_9RHOB|nr:acetylornithine deacetylase [Marinibacterium profundimaris]OWU73438.1 acetylornithine deacetylase [Marinibacterium profundimaris]